MKICLVYDINNKKYKISMFEIEKEVLMEENKSLRLFEDKNIRVAWNEIEENWYFSVVDIVAVLTEILTS